MGQDHELLVGGAVDVGGDAPGRKGVLDLLGLLHRPAADVEVQAVFKQRVKLQPQQPALGQHGAVLLDVAAEIGLQGRVRDDQRLPEQGPALGPADVEHVRELCHILQGHVGGGQAVAHPGPVHEQDHVVPVAGGADVLQLLERIDRAVLGGEGDIHHPGLGDMLLDGARPVVLADLGHLGGGELAVLGGEGQDLVAHMLQRAGLMGVDVAGLGADHGLIGQQAGADAGVVGLGAAHQEVYRCVRAGQVFFDLIGGLLAPGVDAIAAVGGVVGLRQGLQYGGVGPLAVVVVEAYHSVSPKFIFLSQ